MKLHDLRPAEGSHRPRTRVGRGIAAGKGKTAGRGTKGQKARAGGSIPPWFEGGQTPLHMRIPKLRGFKNRFKVDYEVVNVGSIAKAAEAGAFEAGDLPGAKTAKTSKAAPVTINQDVLRAVGLVRTLSKPLKVLGNGDLSMPLFVVADGFSKSAVSKIEAAGGTVQVLERPTTPLAALGVELPAEAADSARAVEAAEPVAEPVEEAAPKPARSPRARKAKAETETDEVETDSDEAEATVGTDTESESEPATEPDETTGA